MALSQAPADLATPVLDRAALESATRRFLRPRKRTRPDLRLVEWGGRLHVAKDWSNAPAPLRCR